MRQGKGLWYSNFPWAKGSTGTPRVFVKPLVNMEIGTSASYILEKVRGEIFNELLDLVENACCKF